MPRFLTAYPPDVVEDLLEETHPQPNLPLSSGQGVIVRRIELAEGLRPEINRV